MEPIDHKRGDLIAAIQEGNLKKVSCLTKSFNERSLISWRPGFNLLCQTLTRKHLEIAKILIKHGCQIFSRDKRISALHYACIYGDLAIIKLLIEKGSSLVQKIENEVIPFHLFAKRCPVDEESALILDYFLRQTNLHINYRDSNSKFTLLHFAAECGNLGMICLILRKTSFLETKAIRNQTALHIAAQRGQANAVRLLLRYGSLYIAQDYFEKTPLCLAVEKNDLKTIEAFFDHFIRLEPRAKYLSPIVNDTMVIYCAIETRNEILIKLLILKGAKTNNYWIKFGETPLHLAVEKGYENIVSLLLENGAIPNKPLLVRSLGSTELHIAAEKGNEAIFKILLKHGGDPRKRNNFQINPLHIATKKGSFSMIDAILKSGYDIPSMFNAELTEGRTPLHYAIEHCTYEVVSLFLEHDISLNALDNCSLSPLHLAARKGNKAVVELLLSRGVIIYPRAFDLSLKMTVESPLYFAAEAGSLDIVKIFYEASTVCKNDYLEKYTAMFVAAYNGHENVVKFFLEEGVSPNDIFPNYLSPLYVASQQGHLNIVNLLLLNDAKVNPKRNSKLNGFSTPLIAACLRGHESIVEALLNYGADVDAKLNIGNISDIVPDECLLKYGYSYESFQFTSKEFRNEFMPIHYAAASGKKGIVELLLKKGACIDSRTGNNTTPLFVALDKNHVEVVACLLESGARIDFEVYGQCPFFAAIRKKSLPIVKLILKYIDPVAFRTNSIVENGFTPLLLAIIERSPEIVEFFLKEGINPDFCTEDDDDSCYSDFDIRFEYPLHAAVTAANETVVEKLIEFGASLDSVCIQGLTPIFHAVKTNKIKMLQLLLQHGASFESRNRMGETLLHFALNGGTTSLAMVKFLLEYGADVDAKCNGLYPIDYVYARAFIIDANRARTFQNNSDKEQKLSLLLKFGSPVNLTTRDSNETYFCFDSEMGAFRSAKLLLQYGADINVLNKDGRSPFWSVCHEATQAFLGEEQEEEYSKMGNDELNRKFDLSSNEWRFFCGNWQRNFPNSRYDELIAEIEEYRHIAKLWTCAIVKTIACNKKIVDENRVIADNIFIRRFYQLCMKEIRQMQQTIVSDNVTFFDILTVRDDKLVNFTRNRDVMEVMEMCDYRELFPLYGEEVEFKLRRAIEKRDVTQFSIYILNKLIGVKLPIIIIYEIFSYLKIQDLRNLCRIHDRYIFVTSDKKKSA